MSWKQTATEMLKGMSKLEAVYTKKITTPDPAGIGSTTETIEVSFYAYPTQVSYGDIQSGAANATDMMILAGAEDLDVKVEPNDTITFGGNTYQVKYDKPVYEEGGVIALHKIVCENR